MKWIAGISLLLVPFLLQASDSVPVRRLLVHQTYFENGNHTRNILMCMNFQSGRHTSTDTLFSTPQDSLSGFEFSQIYLNRFIWNSDASVFDLTERKLILNSHDARQIILRGDSIQFVR